jgi:hypothetical protein
VSGLNFAKALSTGIPEPPFLDINLYTLEITKNNVRSIATHKKLMATPLAQLEADTAGHAPHPITIT